MLEFDGINDYVKLSADGLGTGTIGTFTAELWLRVENTAFTDKWRYALHRSKDGDVGTSVYWIGVHGNDDASYGAAVNGKHTVGDTDVPIDNDWHHIALVYDGTTQFVYLDGELKKSGAVGAFNNTRTGNYYAIGSATYNATKRPFSGNIAEVRIWDHARTADQIQALMHTQLTGAEQGLANYWPLDGADGTVVEDKSPSGNDGTLVNGPVWASEKGFTYWQVVGPLPATLLILR